MIDAEKKTVPPYETIEIKGRVYGAGHPYYLKKKPSVNYTKMFLVPELMKLIHFQVLILILLIKEKMMLRKRLGWNGRRLD